MIVSNNVRCPGPIAWPGNYLDDWPLLCQAGFGFVDIILPVPDDLTSWSSCPHLAWLIALWRFCWLNLQKARTSASRLFFQRYSYRTDAVLRNPDNDLGRTSSSGGYTPLDVRSASGCKLGHIVHDWAYLRKVCLDSPIEAILTIGTMLISS